MNKNRTLCALIAGSTVTLAGAASVHADDFIWVSPVSGPWSAPTNWLGGTSPTTGLSDAVISFGSVATTNYTATNDLGGWIAANRLRFTNGSKALVTVTNASGSGVSLAGSGAKIELSGSGTHTLANASGGLGLSLDENVGVDITGWGTLLVSAPISGSGGLTVNGIEPNSVAAYLHLRSGTGANTFSGGVRLQSGNLMLEGTTTTASPAGSGALTIDGGCLGFMGTLTRISSSTVLNADLQVSKGTGRIVGPVTVNSPSAKLWIFGGTLNLDSALPIGGATILGGRAGYAASTGPATLTLASNATLLTTPSVALKDGATLNIDSSSTNLTDRVNDAAAVALQSGVVSFRGHNDGSSETIGAVTVTGYSTLESRPGASASSGPGNLLLTSLARSENGTLFVRGQNLGVPTAAKYATIKVAGGAPALIGGGATATSASIVPWATASYSTTSSTSSNPNSFATYVPGVGFRPLDPATEFAFGLGLDAADNVNVNVSVNNDNAVTVNSLLLTSASSVSITGTGSIAVTSGAVLTNAGGSSSAISNTLAFGSTEAVFTNSGPLNVSGPLVGSGGLTKAGSWPLVLTGDNTGLTGTLVISGDSSSSRPRVDVLSESNLPGTGPIHVYSGATTASAGVGVSNNFVSTAPPITIGRPIVAHSGLVGLTTLTPSTTAVFTGVVSGEGSINVNSNGSFGIVELAGENTYAGITRINAGTLRIHSDANLGNGGALVLAANSNSQGLELAGNWTTGRSVFMLFESGVQTFGFDAVINGPLVGSADLSKWGAGKLVLNADSAYTGLIDLWEGELQVNGHVPAAVDAGPLVTLSGRGWLGDVSLEGTLSPGSDGTPAAALSMKSLRLYTGVIKFDLGTADRVVIGGAFTKDTLSGTTFQFDFNTPVALTPGTAYELVRFGSTTFAASDFTFTGPASLAGTFEMTPTGLWFRTAVPPCTADVAGLGGSPGADGQITVDDLVYFLSQFFAGELAVADIAALGGTPGADGQITVDDLVFYLSQFFAGCP